MNHGKEDYKISDQYPDEAQQFQHTSMLPVLHMRLQSQDTMCTCSYITCMISWQNFMCMYFCNKGARVNVRKIRGYRKWSKDIEWINWWMKSPNKSFSRKKRSDREKWMRYKNAPHGLAIQRDSTQGSFNCGVKVDD